MESPSANASNEDLLHPLEVRVLQLSQELTQTNQNVPALSDNEVITKLNMIAETLEEVETNFRKERSSPYRRDGHLIGNLLQVLEQNEDFYPMVNTLLTLKNLSKEMRKLQLTSTSVITWQLEGKLSDLSINGVKAAACRLLLATVPVNSRTIVRVLDDDEEMLERVCSFATDSDPGLRCYATGLLSVGLRDRSVADTVVNSATPVKLLKRARMFASKLEKEKQQAVKYIQDHLCVIASHRHKKILNSGGGISIKATTPQRPSKRKLSDTINRAANHMSDHSENTETVTSEQTNEEEEPTATIHIQEPLSILNHEEDVMGVLGDEGTVVLPSPEHHEEDFKRLVMLELLYTLDCLGSMGEYLEILAPALREDITGTIITFLHSKNPAVISHTMTLTSHFLAHKKFSFSLVETGGVDLLFSVFKLQQAAGQVGLLDRSLSMCLHGFASSSAVIERLVAMNHDSMFSAAYQLLSSPNDRARQNAVVFFSLTLNYKVILDYFEKHNGLYTILNIIRVGNYPKSVAQRQLAQDACLCLRQYVRMHMALVTHRLRRKLAQLNNPSNRQNNTAPLLTAATAASRIPARVPKITWSKAVDLDDKTHEQNMVFYEKYRFSASSGNLNNSWSAATGPGGGMWPPAAKLHHLRGILALLEVVAIMCSVVQNTDPDANSSAVRIWTAERAQFCLDSLRVLTLVVPSLANEVCSTEVIFEENSSSKKVGITILLEIAMSSNPRDSELVRDALRVFCNCVSPPHHEDCWQHPLKDIRQYTLTARSMRTRKDDQSQHSNIEIADKDANMSTPDSCSNCCPKAKDDKMLRPVRKLARERNAIKVCVYLLRYKRSVQNADAIRLLATRSLLGLSRDRHISQIIEKMQVGQLLSDMIRSDPVLEENADIHVRFRESALDLISHVTHRASNVVINEATDPTVRKIEKASIVANTKIAYDENELLRLIHDHLLTKGLHHTASALCDEAKIDVGLPKIPSTNAISSCGISSQKSVESSGFPSHKQLSEKYQKVPSSVLHRRESGYLSGDEMSRPRKLQRVSSLDSIVPELKKFQVVDRSDESMSRPLDRQIKMTMPATQCSHSRKRMWQTFQKPHFFQNFMPTPRDRRPQVASDTVRTDAHQRLPKNTRLCANNGVDSVSVSSKLDDIITHYLREQHRQCANPVTTVPPFKLLGKGSRHRCPDFSATTLSNLSICSRLLRRGRTGSSMGSSTFLTSFADSGINRYIYSRYRPYRTVGAHVGSFAWGGVSVARFFGQDQQDMLIGNHDGELRQIHIESDHVVEEWLCHSPSSAIVSLETNETTLLGLQSRLIVTGAVALSELAVNEIALWDASDTSSLIERWRFQGGLRPEFNHYGDRLVALDARLKEDGDEVGPRIKGAIVLDTATGDVLCDLKDAERSNDYGAETNCCYSPCDGTILTDGMLWDARIPTRAIYKFDKLSNVGCGFYHPSGNEVIVNSAVWDLRTYRLLRMVPALDKCSIKFNPSGTVLFAYYPYAGGDYLERRKTKLKSWFRVLDARDYKDITTIDLGHPVFDLSLNTKSTLLSVVEGRYLEAGDLEDDDSICRLYDVGRKRPAEDDSDAEDGEDDSDTLDDDEYDDENSSDDDDEMGGDRDTDDSEDLMSDVSSDEVDSTNEDEEDEGSDEDVASLILADEENSGDEDGDGSILSAQDLGYLLDPPETTYYEVHGQYSSDEDDADEDE
ncbi:putative quinoprotein alcohol dehydrogenase-like superfamily [Plasmopara halstedii]